MKFLEFTTRLFRGVFWPLRVNATFFFFMYVLGIVCAWCTLPVGRGAHLYEYLYAELLVDVYVLCAILALIPRCLRSWLRALLYLIIYATAVIDVYCYAQFGSTLTPTMLLLVAETNGREAGEFLATYLSFDLLFSKVGWILLIAGVHTLFVLRHFAPERWREESRLLIEKLKKPILQQAMTTTLVGGVLFTGVLIWSVCLSAHNKTAMIRLMSGRNIGEVEHRLTEDKHAVLYQPVYRLAFSLYANTLAAQQIDQLISASTRATVDSCEYKSPHIVLIIGESYGKHHAQMYGYTMPTTPRQIRRERSGRLIKFTDVVSPWNLTSFVFKHLFSLYDVGSKGEWCDYPLFPELFRKAGYHVTFITNQFLPKAREAVYDFSGGFFLNHPVLSQAQFDARNDRVYRFDESLLGEYDRLREQNTAHNLTIFHLMGQHVTYKQRYPTNRGRWTGTDYETLRPDLTRRQRQVLAEYDNAVLYNDSVVDQVIRRFEREEAIVIYVPDHGEECYEGNRGLICRNHSAEIDYDLAKYEFEIPFWIWCSRRYVLRHPEVYRAVIEARHRRFMTDALPHLLLYLAGIHTRDYKEENNLLSPTYNERRPRILKGKTDYDTLHP